MAIRKYSFFKLFSFILFVSIFTVSLFLPGALYSQIIKADSLHPIFIDSLRIKDTQYLSLSTSDTVSYSKYIWSDKRDLSEIMNEESGFFRHFLYRGGINSLSYNNSYDIGVFRDGVQVNLPFIAGYDNELFSVNEIDKIEILSNISSQLYGLGNQNKSINIITKDVFNSKPFSQLRYSQDRFNSFDVDFYISLPFSKKYKFDLGLNKYSLDGRYSGSAFDSWRGRGRLSYYPSTRANFKFNFNFASIDRNPYNGIKTNIGDFSRDSFIDSVKNTPGIAVDSIVPTDYKLLSANITADLKLFANPENTSKVYAFYQKYTNDTISEKDQSAGISFTQKISLIKNILSSEFNGMYTYIDSKKNYYNPSNSLLQTYLKMDLSYKFLHASGYSKYFSYFGYSYLVSGIEGKFNLLNNDKFNFNLIGGISGYFSLNDKASSSDSLYTTAIATHSPSSNHQYFEYGFDVTYRNNKLTVKHFNNQFGNFQQLFSNNFVNFNVSFEGKTKFFDYYVNYDSYKEDYTISNPVKANVTYHDHFFKDHLDLHAGIDFKYFRANAGKSYFTSPIPFQLIGSETIERNNFLVDVFVGARIGHANVNLTVANVFNNLVFDRYLFPYDNRGGLGNAISRFTIVWDFIN